MNRVNIQGDASLSLYTSAVVVAAAFAGVIQVDSCIGPLIEGSHAWERTYQGLRTRRR
jgi:hypothetical protein